MEAARFHATPVQTAQTDGTKNQPPYCWAANWIWADGRGGGPLRSGSSPGFQTPHPLLGSTEENKDEQALLKEGRSPFLERFFPFLFHFVGLRLNCGGGGCGRGERKERGEEEAEGIGNIGYWRRREDGRRAQARDRRR